MPYQDRQYQDHIIDHDEVPEGPQRLGSSRGPFLGGLILLLIILAMITTSFWSKNFGGRPPVVSPSNAPATSSLSSPSASSFPPGTSSQDTPFSLDLGASLLGWKLVQALDSLSNTGEVWTTLIDHPSQIAVHLICYGYDEVLVTIELTARNVDNPYLTQSAIFYCQPEGEDGWIIFDQGTDGPFNQLMIMPMHDPAGVPVDRWVAGIEEPLCGNYVGALPGAGIDICPSASPPSSPVATPKPSSPSATSSPLSSVTTANPSSGPTK